MALSRVTRHALRVTNIIALSPFYSLFYKVSRENYNITDKLNANVFIAFFYDRYFHFC